jgi:hypothetical protein
MNKDGNFVNENTSYPLLPQLPKRKYKKKWQEIVKKQNYFCNACGRQLISDHALSYKGCHSELNRKILKTCCFSKKLFNHFKAFDLAFFYINFGFA